MVYGFDWSSWHVSHGIQIKFLFQDKVGELYICFNSPADLCKYAFGIFRRVSSQMASRSSNVLVCELRTLHKDTD